VTSDAAPSIDLEEPGTRGAVVFERVFQEHAPYVWRALRRLGVAEADADDVCQEVFIVVYRKLGTFHGGSSLRTWLYAICLRVASEHRRRPHRLREEVVAAVPDEGVAAAQEEELQRRQALGLLDQALDQLDDEKRAVFVLFELEQMSMVEVAAAAGCPLQTAYSRLYAARKTVEAALARAHRIGPGAPSGRSNA
jgi:RNA polymerase sigma-70 factor (ECF subfamily)